MSDDLMSSEALARAAHWPTYRPVRLIGQGGFGLVYLCHRRGTGGGSDSSGHPAHAKRRRLGDVSGDVRDVASLTAPVAVKAIPMHALSDEEVLLAMTEVSLVKQLDHPNILRFEDFFMDEVGDQLCLVTEYAAGGDLAGLIRAHQQRHRQLHTQATMRQGRDGNETGTLPLAYSKKFAHGERTCAGASDASPGAAHGGDGWGGRSAMGSYQLGSRDGGGDSRGGFAGFGGSWGSEGADATFFPATPMAASEVEVGMATAGTGSGGAAASPAGTGTATASTRSSAAVAPALGYWIDSFRILDIARQCLDGLAYLHSLSILHRDIKPANLYLMAGSGALRIGDFGVSKLLNPSDPVTGTFLGTPFYLSPELCLGEPYSFPADIWALGVVVYELYCLELPFSADNVLAQIHAVTEGAYDRARLRQPHLFDGDRLAELKALYGSDFGRKEPLMHSLVVRLVEGMLTPDPLQRPSAEQLLMSVFGMLPTYITRPGSRSTLLLTGATSLASRPPSRGLGVAQGWEELGRAAGGARTPGGGPSTGARRASAVSVEPPEEGRAAAADAGAGGVRSGSSVSGLPLLDSRALASRVDEQMDAIYEHLTPSRRAGLATMLREDAAGDPSRDDGRAGAGPRGSLREDDPLSPPAALRLSFPLLFADGKGGGAGEEEGVTDPERSGGGRSGDTGAGAVPRPWTQWQQRGSDGLRPRSSPQRVSGGVHRGPRPPVSSPHRRAQHGGGVQPTVCTPTSAGKPDVLLCLEEELETDAGVGPRAATGSPGGHELDELACTEQWVDAEAFARQVPWLANAEAFSALRLSHASDGVVLMERVGSREGGAGAAKAGPAYPHQRVGGGGLSAHDGEDPACGTVGEEAHPAGTGMATRAASMRSWDAGERTAVAPSFSPPPPTPVLRSASGSPSSRHASRTPSRAPTPASISGSTDAATALSRGWALGSGCRPLAPRSHGSSSALPLTTTPTPVPAWPLDGLWLQELGGAVGSPAAPPSLPPRLGSDAAPPATPSPAAGPTLNTSTDHTDLDLRAEGPRRGGHAGVLSGRGGVRAAALSLGEGAEAGLGPRSASLRLRPVSAQPSVVTGSLALGDATAAAATAAHAVDHRPPLVSDPTPAPAAPRLSDPLVEPPPVGRCEGVSTRELEALLRAKILAHHAQRQQRLQAYRAQAEQRRAGYAGLRGQLSRLYTQVYHSALVGATSAVEVASTSASPSPSPPPLLHTTQAPLPGLNTPPPAPLMPGASVPLSPSPPAGDWLEMTARSAIAEASARQRMATDRGLGTGCEGGLGATFSSPVRSVVAPLPASARGPGSGLADVLSTRAAAAVAAAAERAAAVETLRRAFATEAHRPRRVLVVPPWVPPRPDKLFPDLWESSSVEDEPVEGEGGEGEGVAVDARGMPRPRPAVLEEVVRWRWSAPPSSAAVSSSSSEDSAEESAESVETEGSEAAVASEASGDVDSESECVSSSGTTPTLARRRQRGRGEVYRAPPTRGAVTPPQHRRSTAPPPPLPALPPTSGRRARSSATTTTTVTITTTSRTPATLTGTSTAERTSGRRQHSSDGDDAEESESDTEDSDTASDASTTDSAASTSCTPSATSTSVTTSSSSESESSTESDTVEDESDEDEDDEEDEEEEDMSYAYTTLIDPSTRCRYFEYSIPVTLELVSTLPCAGPLPRPPPKSLAPTSGPPLLPDATRHPSRPQRGRESIAKTRGAPAPASPRGAAAARQGAPRTLASDGAPPSQPIEPPQPPQPPAKDEAPLRVDGVSTGVAVAPAVVHARTKAPAPAPPPAVRATEVSPRAPSPKTPAELPAPPPPPPRTLADRELPFTIALRPLRPRTRLSGVLWRLLKALRQRNLLVPLLAAHRGHSLTETVQAVRTTRLHELPLYYCMSPTPPPAPDGAGKGRRREVGSGASVVALRSDEAWAQAFGHWRDADARNQLPFLRLYLVVP